MGSPTAGAPLPHYNARTTTFSPLQWLAPEKLRGCGAVLLHPSGGRFVNELATRDRVASAITALPGKAAWLLLGAAGARSFGEATLGFYASKGLVRKVGKQRGANGGPGRMCTGWRKAGRWLSARLAA